MGRIGNILRRVSPRGAQLLGKAYNDVVHLKYHGRPIAEVFTTIHQTNHWKSAESVSGPGSALDQTERVRAWLPTLLNHLGVRTMLDLPCGDFGWLSKTTLPLDQYIGGDIVESIVAQNQARYGDATHRFERLDLTSSALPAVDLVMTRDCLVHLSNDMVFKAFDNLGRSNIKWALLTTFTRHNNRDIVTGNWRQVNLAQAPFSLPDPVLLLNEGCTEGGTENADKCLGLYPIAALREAAKRA